MVSELWTRIYQNSELKVELTSNSVLELFIELEPSQK